MMQGQAPDFIDDIQGRLPRLLKWCLMGTGGAAGYAYAQQHGSSVATSCIVAGAAIGFGLIVVLFMGARLLKLAAILAVVLVVINYAVLIPFGYGDHMAAWIATGQSWGIAMLDALLRLVGRWVEGLQ